MTTQHLQQGSPAYWREVRRQLRASAGEYATLALNYIRVARIAHAGGGTTSEVASWVKLSLAYRFKARGCRTALAALEGGVL